MSDASKRSHIPDEQLVELTEKKLDALDDECAELERRLANAPDDKRTHRALQNKEEAAGKLTDRREDMLNAEHRGDH